jgi:5'-deoxynucleotidase YfbR-like HD superfamily hydrolase
MLTSNFCQGSSMKHYFAFAFLVLMSQQVFALDSDTIYWQPGYKLKWEDFKAAPETGTVYLAITSSGIDYSYSLTDSSFSFTVYSFFEKKKSWRKDKVDAYILNHEQVHFDITEIFARKLRSQLSSFIPNRKTIKIEIAKMAENIIQEKENLQDLYDRETLFSNNTAKQVYWNGKVKKLLASLDAYRSFGPKKPSLSTKMRSAVVDVIH